MPASAAATASGCVGGTPGETTRSWIPFSTAVGGAASTIVLAPREASSCIAGVFSRSRTVTIAPALRSVRAHAVPAIPVPRTRTARSAYTSVIG
jgi:hypothetical protein